MNRIERVAPVRDTYSNMCIQKPKIICSFAFFSIFIFNTSISTSPAPTPSPADHEQLLQNAFKNRS